MELTDTTLPTVFIVTALAAPLVLAEASGEDLEKGSEEHQYDNEKGASDEERYSQTGSG